MNEHHSNDEKIIIDYFRKIKSADIERLLSLFSENAVIFEPFSKTKIIGRSQIETFLKTVIMANTGMQTDLEFISNDKKDNHQQVVLVTFNKSSILKGRFTFELDRPERFATDRTIKSLKIQFV